jgi:hypothetical protein
MDQIKKFSPAAFVIIIFCFFLPFVNITCGGQSVMSLTGIQLITGAEYKPQGMFDQKDLAEDSAWQEKDKLSVEQRNIDFQPMALLALLMAVIALALSFIRKKMTVVICMVVSVLGAVFLLLLKASLDSDTPSEAQLIIEIEYQFWYWFALLLFIAGAVLEWFNFRETDEAITVSGLPQA